MDIGDQAESVADFLKGLASTQRLFILCELVEGERNVTDLVAATGISQTSMSQHLAKLKKERIVRFRRDHRMRYYSIASEPVMRIMVILHKAFCGPKDGSRISGVGTGSSEIGQADGARR